MHIPARAEMAVAAEEVVEMTEQINLEELIQEIEQGNSDFVLTRQETVITPKKKKIGVFPIADDAWVDVGQWSEYREAAEKLKK